MARRDMQPREQLLAKRLLRGGAIRLHFKKILTIGFRIIRIGRFYTGGIAVSKESRKLRRDAARAGKHRAVDLAIFVAGATLLAPWAVAQEAAAPAENTNTTAKSDDDLTEILVTGIRKALETSQNSSETPIRSSTRSPHPTSAPSPTSPLPKLSSA